MNMDANASTVLVTGGAGFIGSAAIQPLTRSGFTVRAGVRRARVSAEAADAQDLWPCDLDQPGQVLDAVQDAGVVVHTAYGDHNAMVQQCRNVLSAMDTANAANIIHLSSIAVYGGQIGDIDETAPLGPPLDEYAAAKIECESLLGEWAGKADRRAVILRPGIVYGAGSPFWIEKMSLRITSGAWGLFGAAGEGRAALVHVDDVVATIAQAAGRLFSAERKTLPPVTIANVIGPDAVSWNEYFSALAQKLGAPPLPQRSAGAIATRQKLAIAAKVWRKLGLPGGEATSLAPTSGEMQLFSRRANYRPGATDTLFGFTPQIDLQDGLGRSIPRT